MTDAEDRLARALYSLEGLSVGDAFGEQFFASRADLARLWLHGANTTETLRALHVQAAPPPWPWTDDTALALPIVAQLARDGSIDEDDLGRRFADQYAADWHRGYGPAMHTLLPQLGHPKKGRSATRRLFGGQGSFGNGAAMRVAPLGAFFADDLDAVIEQARRSAMVTHAHPEGIAGAIAVACAAAWACCARGGQVPLPSDFITQVLPSVPESEVAQKIRVARDLPPDTSVVMAVNALGNGSRVTAQDTVPFVLWAAARHLMNYEEALWETVSGLGDMDTTCAMVGGIVACYTGVEGIPPAWREHREPLPAWFLGEVTRDHETASGEDDSSVVTLFRPVGPKELALIAESGYRAFPPRLAEQPIFYPVLNEAYAAQIARLWNVRASGAGYVTRFQVAAAYPARYTVQQVGSTLHQEYWIPAEELDEFNRHLVGPIEVIAEFHPPA